MTIRIREARPHEYERLGDILVEAYSTYAAIDAGYAAALPDYAVQLRDIASRAVVCTILVAVDEEGQILGGVTYVPGPDPYAESEEEGEATIRMLAVAPRAQGQGIGRALTEACIELARAQGRRRIALTTMPVMTRARRLYERLGFRRVPGRDWSPVTGISLLGYELDLA